MRDINDGDDITNADWNALARDMSEETHVQEGCKVTVSGGLTINISSGTAIFSGAENTVSGGTKTLSGNTSYEYRYDLIRTDGTGSVVVVEGSSNNIVPTLSSGVGLGFVQVSSGTTALTADNVYDSRIVTNDLIKRPQDFEMLTSGGVAGFTASGETTVTVTTVYPVLVALEGKTDSGVQISYTVDGQSLSGANVTFYNEGTTSGSFGYKIIAVRW